MTEKPRQWPRRAFFISLSRLLWRQRNICNTTESGFACRNIPRTDTSVPKKEDLPMEAERLEQLWAGQFGDDYVNRNRHAWKTRESFWNRILIEFPARRVLEIGCNVGANIHWIARHMPPGGIFGVDINLGALSELRRSVPLANALCSAARRLPFRDASFDLVFTMGVLIHQPDHSLPLVIEEAYRCSCKYLFFGEYFADETTEIPYRGQRGALFKRDYGRISGDLFPDLVLRTTGFLGRDQGWDDVTYWLFEKPQERVQAI